MPVPRDDEAFAGSPRPGPGLLEGGGHAGRGLAGAEDDGSPFGLPGGGLELGRRKRCLQSGIEQGIEDFGIVWHGVTLREKSYA